MKRLLACMMLPCVLVCARIGFAQAAAPENADAFNSKVWELTSYLKGTPTQIRDRLNGEVERLRAKVQETHQNIRESRADSLRDQQACVDKLHATPAYQQLAAQEKQAKADLDQARANGSPTDRIEASSRYNKLRTAVQKLDSGAVNHCKEMDADLKRLHEYESNLKRYNTALDTATQWRQGLLRAIRNGFCMKGPLKVGSSGVLPEAKVLKVVGPHSALLFYKAPQLLKQGKEEEGVQTFSAIEWKVKLLVTGIDTKNLKVDQTIPLDHNLVVTKSEDDEKEGQIYDAKAAPTDIDRLLQTIVPLKSDSATGAGKTVKSIGASEPEQK